MDRRRLVIALVTVGLVVLACLPTVVAFGLGWMKLPHIEPVGVRSARETTSPEAWALFALFYLAWMAALTVLLIWSYDHLDYHWQYHERAPRRRRKQRGRLTATLKIVEAEDKARARAARRPSQPRKRP